MGDASARDIKKAYRKLARKHHPDKGGDAAKFKELTTAHEILSNEEKKENYDKYGDPDGQSGGDGDIFSMFFGGGGGGGRGGRKRKGENANFPLKVTLKELYTGCTKHIRLKKNIICMDCKGKGGHGVTVCRQCNGQGMVITERQIGPGMKQRMQSQCHACNGKGEVIRDGMICKKCRGAKVIATTQTLTVNVNRGMSNGEKIVFHGEGEQKPGVIPGNVIVVLQQERHRDFRREGNNLFIKKRLSLKEALCGFKFVFTHLDDRRFLVTSEPGKIYFHGDIKCISDEGMMDSFGRGNLYIEFEVEFHRPDHFTEEQKRRLRSLLPKVKSLGIDRTREDVDEVVLIEVDIAAEKRRFSAQKAKNQYDEDEDGGGGHRGGTTTTQCQTQ